MIITEDENVVLKCQFTRNLNKVQNIKNKQKRQLCSINQYIIAYILWAPVNIIPKKYLFVAHLVIHLSYSK